MTSMLHEQLTNRIIGAAIAVHKVLGPGLKEQSYQAALAMEFNEVGLEYQRAPVFHVTYRGAIVGEHIPDFIVEGAVVVELKAVRALEPVFTAQVLTYLRLSGLHVGLTNRPTLPSLKYCV